MHISVTRAYSPPLGGTAACNQGEACHHSKHTHTAYQTGGEPGMGKTLTGLLLTRASVLHH